MSAGTSRVRLSWFRRLIIATGVVEFILLIVGAITRIEGSDSGCASSWTVCSGDALPVASAHISLGNILWLLTGIFVGLAVGLLVAGWLIRRLSRLFVLLPALAFGLALLQVWLGHLVTSGGSAGLAIAFLGTVQLYLLLMLLIALLAFSDRISPANEFSLGSGWTRFGPYAAAACVAVFMLTLTGGLGTPTSPELACPEWPGCHGNYLPSGTTPLDIHLTHRWLAIIATGAVILMTAQSWRIRRDAPAITGLAFATVALMAAQIFIGAASIWLELASWVSATHLAVAILIWSALVALTVLDRMIPVQEAGRRAYPATRRPIRAIAADFFTTMKPGVLLLLLLTTLVAMLVATTSWPSPSILFWTLLGGALSAGGAGAINHFVDRDIDAVMSRTSGRPIPQGRLEPLHVLFFGITLSVVAVMILSSFVNPLAAAVALSGNLFYVFVYTIWLKRSTPQNIVIGGAAGAVPPVVGWAAVTGTIGLPALLMFGFIFLWTPPHFWALALFKRTDYAVAGVPMLPAVRGEEETRRQILLYSLLMVAASLLFAATGALGFFYLAAAGGLGAVFIYRAYQLQREPSDEAARGLFLYSMLYLGLVFLAMVVDRLIVAAI